MQQHVGGGERPSLDQRMRIRREVGVREHRALRTAGGAGGVKDGGEVVRGAWNVVEGVRLPGGERHQAAIARRPECAAVGNAGACAKGGPGGFVLRAAYEQRGLRVFQEIVEFGLGVCGVERQIRGPGAQAREIEKQHLGGLIGLNGNPVARLDAQGRERVGQPRRYLIHIAKAIAFAASGLDGGLFCIPPTALELRKEIA